MKISTIVLIAPMYCLAWATAPLAQEEGTAPVAGHVTLGVSMEQTTLVASGWRASRLLHSGVYNEKDEFVGRIEDFIVSPDGAISVAILDVGGFLGVGTHRVAIPVQDFGQVTPKIVLPGASKNELKKMPEFQYGS